MEASALKQLRLGASMRTRTPLLKLQSDERLVTLVRRGNHAAFDALVARYQARLLAFCRHLLRSREDAEDVLQDVFASAFKAMIADERPISVRPWLYRIARNRCLNHLRRMSAIGVDSIEDHVSEHVPSTSDAVQRREDLWQLVGDIQQLPESQRSALLLREMEALSYEQIAQVMDKTIPSVKSLLIRARRGLAESAEARTLTCGEAMCEVGECHLGRRHRVSRVVRRHLGACPRCASLPLPCEPATSVRGFWPLAPLAPVLALRRFAITQLLHGARAGSTATAAGAGAGAGASTVFGGSGTAGLVSAGLGGLAGKAAVGLTAAVIGVAGVAAVDGGGSAHRHPRSASAPLTARSAARPDGPTGGAPVLAATPMAPRRPSGQSAPAARTKHASTTPTTPTTATTATAATTPGAHTTPVGTPTTATVANAPGTTTGTRSTGTTTSPAGGVTGTVATSSTSTGPTGGVAPTAPVTQPVTTSTDPTTTSPSSGGGSAGG